MDHIRNQIWDFLYRSGPQAIEQIAEGVGIDPAIVHELTRHEWFEIVDTKVQIATKKPPSSFTGSIA